MENKIIKIIVIGIISIIMSIGQYFIREQSQSLSDDKLFVDSVEASGIYDSTYIDSRFPVSPVTGHPITDTAKLLDINVTEFEKTKIMNSLKKIDGYYLPNKLTDKEIYDLVPPRYFTNDQVDVQRWRDYLSKEIIPNMDKSVVNTAIDTVDTGNDSVDNSTND